MQKSVELIVNYCVTHQLIAPDDIAWLQYCLEKRLTTVIVLIPFLGIAIWLTDIYSAAGFFITFFVLRKRMNGYHSSSFCTCLFLSLILEAAFLLGLYPFLTPTISLLLCTICAVLIFLFAPYNHPNMHYTEEELIALRHQLQIILCVLIPIIFISYAFQWNSFAHGAITGIVMAVFLLCLAYIMNRRYPYENP